MIPSFAPRAVSLVASLSLIGLAVVGCGRGDKEAPRSTEPSASAAAESALVELRAVVAERRTAQKACKVAVEAALAARSEDVATKVTKPKDKATLVGSEAWGFDARHFDGSPYVAENVLSSQCRYDVWPTAEIEWPQLKVLHQEREAWAKTEKARIAALPALLTPKQVVARRDVCDGKPIGQYVIGDLKIPVNKYGCRVEYVWIAVAEKRVLAVATGAASVSPKDKPATMKLFDVHAFDQKVKDEALAAAEDKVAPKNAVW